MQSSSSAVCHLISTEGFSLYQFQICNFVLLKQLKINPLTIIGKGGGFVLRLNRVNGKKGTRLNVCTTLHYSIIRFTTFLIHMIIPCSSSCEYYQNKILYLHLALISLQRKLRFPRHCKCYLISLIHKNLNAYPLVKVSNKFIFIYSVFKLFQKNEHSIGEI